jgi:hypothetical protein
VAPPWWKAPWRFLVETVTGVFIFGVIGLGAVAIQCLIKYLSSKGIEGVVVWALNAGEVMVLITDLVLFGRFLWKTGSRTWKEM